MDEVEHVKNRFHPVERLENLLCCLLEMLPVGQLPPFQQWQFCIIMTSILESQPTKRRKKVLLKNPNPLFEKWITEWKDEAESKGWKTKFVYQKVRWALFHVSGL